MKKSEVASLLLHSIGALTSLVALFISALALQSANRASALKDRPIIYLEPSNRNFYGGIQRTNVSNEELNAKGWPLNAILAYDQTFNVRNGGSVLAQKLSIATKFRYGSEEHEFPEKFLDFFPTNYPGALVCAFDNQVVETLKRGIPLVVKFKIKYQDSFERPFESEQCFRIDFMIWKETFRGVYMSSIPNRDWDKASGNSANVGPPSTMENFSGIMRR